MPNYYVHNLDPIAFRLLGIPFPWYWLVYFAGYFWILSAIKYLCKKGLLSYSFKKYYNYILPGFGVLVFSGKLFYVLFYNLSHYLANPLDIFAIWRGGMSFHGSIIGCGLWTWYYSKKHKLNFWKLCDPVATTVPLVLFFGRMANFVNGELAGRPTDVIWAVQFPRLYDMIPRHPSQIYEALLEGLVLFSILWFRRRNLKVPASQTATFLFGYGFFRFIVEFFRNADPQVGYFLTYFTIGQFYCLLMMAFAIKVRPPFRSKGTFPIS